MTTLHTTHETHRERELVDVYLQGGQIITVDATACAENGLLDGDPETTLEMLSEVRKAIRSGVALITVNGYPALFAQSAPLAYGYRAS